MSDDIQRELARIEERRRGAAAAKDSHVQAWRRLRALRDGLAGELEARRRALTVRDTDPHALHAELVRPHRNRLVTARAEAAAAEERHAAHAAGSVAARLRPAWWAEEARLRAEAERLRMGAETLERNLPHTAEDLMVRARQLAEQNRQANARDARPLEPLRERVEVLSTALAALDAGCKSSAACLARWDLPMLAVVARIWRRLKEDGKVSDADYRTYLDARDPPRDPFADALSGLPGVLPGGALPDALGGPVLVRRTTEEVVMLPPGTAPVVDAAFTEAPAFEAMPLPPRQAAPPALPYLPMAPLPLSVDAATPDRVARDRQSL